MIAFKVVYTKNGSGEVVKLVGAQSMVSAAQKATDAREPDEQLVSIEITDQVIL